MGITEEDVMKALRMVIDPELGANIVDLGLVYEVRVENGEDVYVKMTVTVPGCPLSNFLLHDAKKKIEKIEGVGKVDVELTFDPPWTPDRMSPELRRMFGV